MDKIRKKSQNYVGLFKIKVCSKHLQGVVKAISVSCSSIFDGSI